MESHSTSSANIADNKVLGANMGPIWGSQDPGGPHVGPMKLAIWDCLDVNCNLSRLSSFPMISRNWSHDE